jgi:hypothetical protein
VTAAPDDYLSLKATDCTTIRTGQEHAIRIGNTDRWLAEIGVGRHTLALYANIQLPRAGTPEREAVCRGGVRTWYQQIDQPNGAPPDITGLNGPWAPPRFGNKRLLISHTWPHSVDRDRWQFMLCVWAYDEQGKELTGIPLTLATREVKIIGDAR